MTEDKKYNLTAIILAAGTGTRMNCARTKQRIELLGESVLSHTVKSFNAASTVDNIIVVCRAEELDEIKAELSGKYVKFTSQTVGGCCRFESAKLGFSVALRDSRYVAIHDAARCLVTPEQIDSVAMAAFDCGAATASAPITDTLKYAEGGVIDHTVSRYGMYCAQTPQIFESSLYERALNSFSGDPSLITDDNMLVELAGGHIALVDTGRENIKITTKEDLDYAEFILKKRSIQ